jgi:hypothetical protein
MLDSTNATGQPKSRSHKPLKTFGTRKTLLAAPAPALVHFSQHAVASIWSGTDSPAADLYTKNPPFAYRNRLKHKHIKLEESVVNSAHFYLTNERFGFMLKKRATGSEGQAGVRRGEFIAMKPVERFDPEGRNNPKGSGDRMTSQERRRSARTTGRR